MQISAIFSCIVLVCLVLYNCTKDTDSIKRDLSKLDLLNLELNKIKDNNLYPVSDTLVNGKVNSVGMMSHFKDIHYVKGKKNFYNDLICSDSTLKSTLENLDCQTNIILYIDRNGEFQESETRAINEHILKKCSMSVDQFDLIIKGCKKLKRFSPQINNLNISDGGYSFLISCESINRNCNR